MVEQETKKKVIVRTNRQHITDQDRVNILVSKVFPKIHERIGRGEEITDRFWHRDYHMMSSVRPSEMLGSGVLDLDCSDVTNPEYIGKATTIAWNLVDIMKKNNKVSNAKNPPKRDDDTVVQESSQSVAPAENKPVAQDTNTTSDIINRYFKKGDELYCPLYGQVRLEKTSNTDDIRLTCIATGQRVTLNKDGKGSEDPNAILMVYPDANTYNSNKKWTWDKYRPYTLLDNPEPVLCFNFKKGTSSVGVLLGVDELSGKYYVHDSIAKCPKSRSKAYNFIDSGNCAVYDKVCVKKYADALKEMEGFNKLLRHLWDKKQKKDKKQKNEKLPQTNLFEGLV